MAAQQSKAKPLTMQTTVRTTDKTIVSVGDLLWRACGVYKLC